MRAELNILSLGAGVQSSTVLLMALHGELTPLPDAAIFADTGGEPKAVYEWLDWLEKPVAGRIPIHRVTAGNLGADILASIDGGRENKTWHIGQAPFHVINRGGMKGMPPESGGILRRKCTEGYKLRPIRRMVRELQKQAGGARVRQWIGISLDEAHRMKDSGVRDITNVYPLIERRMTRHDCIRWLAAHAYPIPPRSACLYCPYHSNAYWRQLRDESPGEWEATVQFDAALRRGKLPGVTGDAYLHRSFVPLADVDLRTAADHGQTEMQFGNECEGLCGV